MVVKSGCYSCLPKYFHKLYSYKIGDFQLQNVDHLAPAEWHIDPVLQEQGEIGSVRFNSGESINAIEIFFL